MVFISHICDDMARRPLYVRDSSKVQITRPVLCESPRVDHRRTEVFDYLRVKLFFFVNLNLN